MARLSLSSVALRDVIVHGIPVTSESVCKYYNFLENKCTYYSIVLYVYIYIYVLHTLNIMFLFIHVFTYTYI